MTVPLRPQSGPVDSTMEATPIQSPSGRWSRVIGRILCYFLLAYLGVSALFASLQRRLIYLPNTAPVVPQDVRLDPQRVDSVQLSVAGAQLQGWWCTAASEVPVDQRRVIILFPGNAGNRGNRASLIEQWNELDCDVVIFDYRSYGGSTGSPSETNFAADSRCIWDYVTSERGVSPERVVLCGQSLGGGVATRLAWDLSREEVTPGGLVIRSSFTSLVEAGKHHYPWLPVNLVLLDRYPSIERIGDIRSPLLVIHGERDRTVPFAHGRALFEAAPTHSATGVEKCFLPLPRADHNDVMHLYREDITSALRAYLERLPTVR